MANLAHAACARTHLVLDSIVACLSHRFPYPSPLVHADACCFDATQLGYIDVAHANGQVRDASLYIKRNDFAANNAPQNFTLYFTAPASPDMEYRVWWFGGAQLYDLARYVSQVQGPNNTCPSLLPSASVSTTASPSMSPSLTASQSGGLSTSPSPSLSGSISGSASLSPSESATTSGSASASSSGSQSATPTATPSVSPSGSRTWAPQPGPYRRSYSGASLLHQIGLPAGDGSSWAVGINASDAGKNIVYGPFADDAPPAMKLCAWFWMSIDDRASDKLGVASLQVWDGMSLLNERYLPRNAFNATNTPQSFSVCFTTPSSGILALDYRVWTVGVAALTIHRIDVDDCGWPDGYVRVYNPFFASFGHSGGQGYNGVQGWNFSAVGVIGTWGPYASDVPPGIRYRVDFTFAIGERSLHPLLQSRCQCCFDSLWCHVFH